MMNVIAEVECLYLEDNPQDRASYTELIQILWNKHSPNIPIRITAVESTDEAIKQIRENRGKFHLLIADLLFGSHDDKKGLIAIQVARQLDADLGILAFSMGDKYELAETAKAKGADDFYLKTNLTKVEAPQEELVAKLIKILTDHGREPIPATPIPEHLYRKNLPLRAIVETVKPVTISNLVFKVLGRRCTKIIPFFVKPGISGAFVIGVEAHLKVDADSPPDTRSLLLKISKDKSQLQSEFSKREQAQSFGRLFVPFSDNVNLPTSDGWYAISAEHVKSLTLLDWLIHPHSEDVTLETVRKTLKTLFIGSRFKHLYGAYRRREDVTPSFQLWNEMGSARRARVFLACEELSRLAVKYDPSKSFDVSVIRQFISDNIKIGDLNKADVPDGVSVCRNHGDLHGRNILVDENDNPSLVDPANIADLHWASDIARLAVDLIVSGCDAGDQSHEWERMAYWLELSEIFIRDAFKPLSPKAIQPNDRVYTALQWLRTNLREIHPARKAGKAHKPEWEFRLALAVEFLRASYRQQELSTPKRVLGLIAAHYALLRSEENYRSQLT